MTFNVGEHYRFLYPQLIYEVIHYNVRNKASLRLNFESQQAFKKYFLKYFIYLFLERREGKEKERERNNNV